MTGPCDKRTDTCQVHQIRAMCPEEAAGRKGALESGQRDAHLVRPIIGVQQAASALGLDESNGLGGERPMVVCDRNQYARR